MKKRADFEAGSFVFPVRLPEVAYRDTMLWLPKEGLNVNAVKQAMTLVLDDQDLILWKETRDHLIVPREAFEGTVRSSSATVVGPEFPTVEFEDSIIPREDQKEAWAALDKAPGGIFNLACGRGKALAHGEPVLTKKGWVPVENITVEDLVAGVDGRFYPVQGVFPQGERLLYRITFTDRTHVDCDGDHLWQVTKRRSTGQPVAVLSTAELCTVPLQNNSGRKFYVPMCAPVAYQEVALPIDPYLLGVLLGDGHLSIHNRVMLTTEDVELLEYVRLPDRHRFTYLRHASKSSGNADTYLIATDRSDGQNAHIPKLKDLLSDLGLMGCTSHTKFIPDTYIRSPQQDRLALLQGLFDTDGSAKEGQAVDFGSVSEDLIIGVQEIVHSLGGTCTTSSRITRLNGKEFPSFRAYVKLPNGMVPFRLQRKVGRFDQYQRQRGPYRAIDNITPIGTGQATCISVQSPDRLFLTRGHIPTHNTVLGLKKIASRKMSAIVIVNQVALMEQWKHEAMQFLGLEDDQIGWIRQDVFDWEKPLVIAMIHTLSKKHLQWPRAFRRFYGTVIYDEVHHLSAPTFAKTAPLFWGARYGLTATPDRVDKTEFAYFSHLGKVFFSDMSQPLTPRIYFQRLPTEVDMKSDEITDCYGEFNISKFRKYLATRPDRIDLITKDVADAFEQGRRILVLTHIVKGAQMLEKALPGAVRVTGKTKAEKRLSIFKENRLVVATMGVAQEWLNVPDLDTVFFTTPFGNWGSLVQGMGRVLRVHPDKKAPVAMIYEDYKLGPGRALCNRLRRGLRSNGFGWKVLSPPETD